MLYLPVAGTWSRHEPRANAWYRRGSPFDTYLSALGYQRVEQDGDPATPDAGYWSGDLGGTLIQRLWPWSDAHGPWREGGRALRRFLRRRRREFDRAGGVTIIAHSHGGQVAAYALAAMGAAGDIYQPGDVEAIVDLITVDAPIRREMRGVYLDAALKTRRWTHLYSERGWMARMRWLGNRFGPRECKAADENLEIAGGHSGILGAPDYLAQWAEILPAPRESRR